MGRVKWSIDSDEPDDLPVFDTYDGEDPPKGVYRFRLRRLTLKTNSSDDDMFSGLLVLSDTRPGKKQYQGFTVWFNQNITEQGKPYLKQFLVSLGISWQDFMKKTIHDGAKTDDRPAQITVLGGVKLEKEPELRASIGMSKATPQYPAKLEVKTFLPPEDDADVDADGDPIDPDEEEDPFS